MGTAETSHLQTIEVKHELACAQVAAQAQHQHLEATLDQVRLQAERSEAASLARLRDSEMRDQLKQRQEVEALRASMQQEATLSKRCQAFEVQAVRWRTTEIEAQCAEATAAATASAERRRLEAVVEQ